MVSICAVLKLKGSILPILLISPACFSPHYSIEYRTHFTKFHAYHVGNIGATEQLILVELGHLYAYFSVNGNDVINDPFNILGYQVTIGQIIIWGATISGIHYNLHNIAKGLAGAKDKSYALACLIPYVQFLLMLWGSSYSQFFEGYAAYFLVTVGMYLTYVTAIMNLNSTASMSFNWFYFEPFAYAAILYVDINLLLAANQVVYLYATFLGIILIKYFAFMSNVITKLTEYLEINFLTVNGKGAKNVSNNLMGTGRKKDK